MHLISAPVLFSSMPRVAGGLLACLDCPAAYFQQALRQAVAHSMHLHICDDAGDSATQKSRRTASPMASIYNIPQRAAQHACVQPLPAAHIQAAH